MEIIREIYEGPSFGIAKDVYNYLEEFKNQDREHFIVIGLDTKNQPVYREIVSIGTLNSCLAEPREIFKKAIMMSCNGIILAHNHPSGDCKPSKEDIEITKIMKKAGELLRIKVFDHIIISNKDFKSIIDEEVENE